MIRAVVATGIFFWLILGAGSARAQTAAGDEGEATQTTPSPSPSPNAIRLSGYVRSFYFTRQNASNNPGARFDYQPNAKYNSNGVNQATWNTGVSLHAAYAFGSSGWTAGAAYFYANPADGPCVVPANHAKGALCTTQRPPNTNADDTLPGFTLSTLDEAFVGYRRNSFAATLGSQLFDSPWANPSDSRLKPATFSGGRVSYGGVTHWTFELADMPAFEDRTSSSFSRQTLLTSYPAGGKGLPDNIVLPGGTGVDTNGFFYGKAGYDNSAGGLSANGYFYGISDLVNLLWFDGKYTAKGKTVTPFFELQGGVEGNSGRSWLGKIASQDIGARIGARVGKSLEVSAAFDAIPWRTDTIVLPEHVSCSDANNQISVEGATLAYFLPLNAPQCRPGAHGTTQIYYGGWASPYTDGYSTDPFFTTSVTQGPADRRAPGTSWKVSVTYTAADSRFIFIATDAWYDYGNALGPQNTNIWTLDGRYYLTRSSASPHRGLFLRYRYAQRQQSNTYCGAIDTSCPGGLVPGDAYLGGQPLFKYNRAQLEYDF